MAVDPTRNFPGPSVVRASNGDLILTHQDSIHHSWGDVFVHQWRSMDGGFTWQRRNVIFPTTYPDFDRLSKGGPPFYLGVEFLDDGTLLAICYHTPPKNACYILHELRSRSHLGAHQQAF